MSLFLGTTGRIWARTRTITDGGGTADTWTPGPNIECRIAPISGGLEEGAGEAISDRTTHIATIPAYTAVEEGAQMTIEDGQYEVTYVRKRTFDELVRRIELVESAEQLPTSGPSGS